MATSALTGKPEVVKPSRLDYALVAQAIDNTRQRRELLEANLTHPQAGPGTPVDNASNSLASLRQQLAALAEQVAALIALGNGVADEALARTMLGRPRGEASGVSEGELIDVVRDAIGYRVSLDQGQTIIAARVFGG